MYLGYGGGLCGAVGAVIKHNLAFLSPLISAAHQTNQNGILSSYSHIIVMMCVEGREGGVCTWGVVGVCAEGDSRGQLPSITLPPCHP